MDLTIEQAEALRKQPDSTLELIDPATNRHYVVVAREVLDRLREDADDARSARAWQRATLQGMSLALGDDA